MLRRRVRIRADAQHSSAAVNGAIQTAERAEPPQSWPDYKRIPIRKEALEELEAAEEVDRSIPGQLRLLE